MVEIGMTTDVIRDTIVTGTGRMIDIEMTEETAIEIKNAIAGGERTSDA